MKGVALHCRHTWVILGVWLPFAWGLRCPLVPIATLAFDGRPCLVQGVSCGSVVCAVSARGGIRMQHPSQRLCCGCTSPVLGRGVHVAGIGLFAGTLMRNACVVCTCRPLCRGTCVGGLRSATTFVMKLQSPFVWASML